MMIGLDTGVCVADRNNLGGLIGRKCMVARIGKRNQI